MKEQWKVISMITALILVVVFALQNTSNVKVDLFIVAFQVPLVLVILFSLLIGVIVGLLTSMAAIQSNRKDNSSLIKELDQIKVKHQEELLEKEDQIRMLNEELQEKDHHTTFIPDDLETDLDLNIHESQNVPEIHNSLKEDSETIENEANTNH